MHVTLYCICLDSFFSCSGDHRDLHSFPTRRSSDLLLMPTRSPGRSSTGPDVVRMLTPSSFAMRRRSEEHTSELQSLRQVVCGLLIAKNKGPVAIASQHDQFCNTMPVMPGSQESNVT